MNIKNKLRKMVGNIGVYFSDKGYVHYFIKEKKNNTVTRLRGKQLKELKAYFKPYFKINPLFHSFYTEKTGIFDTRYMPDDMWFTKIDRYFNNRQKAKVLDHKSYYEKIFSPKNVKHPETIAHRINGFWYDSAMNIVSYDAVKEIISREKSLFIKLSTGSCGGRGVTHISDKGDIVADFEKSVKHKYDIVIQREIKQHPDLYKVGENSVNSLRIASLLSEEGVTIYSCVLRMGVGASKVDNTSSGGLVCGINDDGRLKDIAWKVCGEKFEQHPTTNVKFSDMKVPSFDKAKALVSELHPLIPDFRLVSWDIAIDEKGEPVLLEVNLCLGGLDLHQLPNGPMFKDDTEKILAEVFGDKRKV